MKKSEQIKKSIINRWMPIYFNNKLLEKTKCYLCQIYKTNRNAFPCNECPIFSYTNETNCVNTPYGKYFINQNRDNAMEELLFLLRLFRHYKKIEKK